MIIKTIQWNIGGGKIREQDSYSANPDAYNIDSLDSIINTLKKYQSDIITLQESHTNDNTNQTQMIADALGLGFVANDVYDSSHLVEGQNLSQSIISRFPISEHHYTAFFNPKYSLMRANGEVWVSHEKGATSARLQISSIVLQVVTSHSLPFRKFSVDMQSEDAIKLRNDMTDKLKADTQYYLYQGDLNYNETSVADFLPGILTDGTMEVLLEDATTPKGRKYDHVFYRGLEHIRSIVDQNVLTDHYPVYSEFTIV